MNYIRSISILTSLCVAGALFANPAQANVVAPVDMIGRNIILVVGKKQVAKQTRIQFTACPIDANTRVIDAKKCAPIGAKDGYTEEELKSQRMEHLLYSVGKGALVVVGVGAVVAGTVFVGGIPAMAVFGLAGGGAGGAVVGILVGGVVAYGLLFHDVVKNLPAKQPSEPSDFGAYQALRDQIIHDVNFSASDEDTLQTIDALGKALKEIDADRVKAAQEKKKEREEAIDRLENLKKKYQPKLP